MYFLVACAGGTVDVDDVPTELGNLKKLEQLILIAQRIIFEKVIVMPKGQQKKN